MVYWPPQFFFVRQDKLNIMGDMDRFCTIIVVIGAVVLLLMGYGEITRLNMYRRGTGTCGMQARAGSSGEDATARSAKRSGQPNTQMMSQKVNDSVGEYLNLVEEWPNETAEDFKHKELPQDEKALGFDFTWEASSEDDKKFDLLKIDPEKVKRTANTKAINPDVTHEEPTQSRRLGLPNTWLHVYHGSGKNDTVKFGQSCTWFGGTDAYYAARKKTANCDCMHEDCDVCTK